MPIDVNGYTVADEMLREEATRLAHEYPWKAAPQTAQKAIGPFSAVEMVCSWERSIRISACRCGRGFRMPRR